MLNTSQVREGPEAASDPVGLTTPARLDVAMTSVRYSVAITMGWKAASRPKGFSLYEPPAF